MTTTRASIDEDEDAAPLEMLAAMFAAHGWAYEYVSEDEVCGEIPGSWTTYQLRGIWRAEDRVLQVLCLPDVRVPDDKLQGGVSNCWRWSTNSCGSAISISGPGRGAALSPRADAGR